MTSTGHLRRARLIAASFVAIITAVSLVVGLVIGALLGAGPVGALVGAVVGAGIAVFALVRARRSTTERILASTRARPVSEREQARLHNLVDGLGVTFGIPLPSVHVIDDAAANAYVIGRDQRGASIAVTTGMLLALDRIAMEAVIAHLVSRIRNDEIVAATLTAGLVGPIADAPAPLSRLAAPILRRAAPEQRIVEADLDACSITRYPPGLVGALETMRSVGVATASATRGSAHLWLAHPFDDGDDAVDTHPPLDRRITMAREL